MTRTFSRAPWTQVACLCLWPLSLLAGVPDPAANLPAGARERMVSDCWDGVGECTKGRGYGDPSRLTPAEDAAIPAGIGVTSAGRQP